MGRTTKVKKSVPGYSVPHGRVRFAQDGKMLNVVGFYSRVTEDSA